MEEKKETRKKNVSEQIYNQLKEQILTGVYAEGEQLQPIREYATYVQVSKNTIHAVYNRLVDEGYVYAVRGSGYFVGQEEGIHTEKTEHSSNVEQTANICDFTRAMEPPFLWEDWEQAMAESLCRIREISSYEYEQICAETEYAIREEIAAYIQKERNLTVLPQQILLCSHVEMAVQYLRELFHNIANEIAYLEPCQPEYRDFFQDDMFQLRRFDRMAAKKKSTQSSFRILFCYLEQFLQETKSPSPYQNWLHEWMELTGSYVLLFDTWRTQTADIAACVAQNLEHVLLLGDFTSCVGKEAAVSYLILPQPLLQKFWHLRRQRPVYPLSHAIALQKFWQEGALQKCMRQWYRQRIQIGQQVRVMADNIFSGKLEIMEPYSYLCDGLVVCLHTDMEQEIFVEQCRQRGVCLKGANDFWYFQKDAGAQMYLLELPERCDKQTEQGFLVMKNVLKKWHTTKK